MGNWLWLWAGWRGWTLWSPSTCVYQHLWWGEHQTIECAGETMVIDHGNSEVGNIRYQLVMVMVMVMVMVTTKADCKTKANTFVQVNLKSCCVVPEELSTFAKENRVNLSTSSNCYFRFLNQTRFKQHPLLSYISCWTFENQVTLLTHSDPGELLPGDTLRFPSLCPCCWYIEENCLRGKDW